MARFGAQKLGIYIVPTEKTSVVTLKTVSKVSFYDHHSTTIYYQHQPRLACQEYLFLKG